MALNYFLNVFVVCCCSATISISAFAQTLEDSLFVNKASQNVIDNFLSSQKDGAPLYNGKTNHIHPKFKAGEHAQFVNDKYTLGTIVYDGLTYKDVRIMYDLVRDQLLLLNRDSSGGIVVQSDHVDSFKLHDHNFINIKSGGTSKKIMPGYYDLLYNGRIALFARRTKKVTEKVGQYVEKIVEQSDSYYLFKDSVYTLVKGKKELIRLLNTTQNENLAYIKSNKLDFNGNKEEAMVRLVSFHDSLKP